MAAYTRDFYIGLFLAISSSLFIGSSFIIKKKGLLKLNIRAGSGGFGYLKEWMWWAGLLLMGVGEAANFVAYAFAPATLVTPLGALSVLVSAFLASKWLKERLNILGKTGCLICLLGSTFIVLHSPKEQEVETLRDLEPHLADPGFIAYCLFVFVVVIIFIFLLGPRYGTTNPFVYIIVTGTIGSLSVMGCKALGVGLKEVFAGKTEVLSDWLFWLIVVFVVFFISVQMVYLNKSLDLFNTAVVTPLLYVVFTTCVIIASGILYKEWANLKVEDIVGNICGFITIICGVFLLQGFKGINITLSSVMTETRLQKGKNYDSDYNDKTTSYHDSYPRNNISYNYNKNYKSNNYATEVGLTSDPLQVVTLDQPTQHLNHLSNSCEGHIPSNRFIPSIDTDEDEFFKQKKNYYSTDNFHHDSSSPHHGNSYHG